MTIDIMRAIERAYEAQCPAVVKIYPMRLDESVFARLPTLRESDKLTLKDTNRERYYIMTASDLFDALEADIQARLDAWMDEGDTESELQYNIERFLADFVDPAGAMER